MTEEQVVEIRALYASGMLQKEIAHRFNRSISTIRQVVYGIGYGHLPLPEYRRTCIDCGLGIKQAKRCKTCRAAYKKKYDTEYQPERHKRAQKRKEQNRDRRADNRNSQPLR